MEQLRRIFFKDRHARKDDQHHSGRRNRLAFASAQVDDGSFAISGEVADFYSNGGPEIPNLIRRFDR
jgi:hypothetical protein